MHVPWFKCRRSTEEEKEIQRSVETHILSLKFLVGWQKRKKPSPGGRPGSPLDNTIWLRKSVERWQSGPLMPALSLKPLPSAAHVFTLREMRKATGNFSQDNLIGEGGFGQVFRGVLSDGKVVAVKQMDPGASARQGTQGEREFRVEVDILSRLNHPNLVRLIGYCADRTHRLLVYEYMVNGNLQELLHGVVRVKLEWHMRLRVALGAARALEYLHTGRAAGNPIIHRDFKSSNILLDEDFNPKVSDFGLAKLVPFGDKHYVSTRVIGTFGYFDPKYTATGRLTVKSDVYGFGVVCLELLTGRRAVDSSYSCGEENLVFRVRETLKSKKKLKKVVDSEISPLTYSFDSVKRFADLAARCIRDEDSKRPMMAECVRELEELYAQSRTFTKSLSM
ncbi:hypothetical protein Mapa_016188 [Marchantia paleacea]|nr:hypothetical protein Mapa_016188 [Marchantia paleacea]